MSANSVYTDDDVYRNKAILDFGKNVLMQLGELSSSIAKETDKMRLYQEVESIRNYVKNQLDIKDNIKQESFSDIINRLCN